MYLIFLFVFTFLFFSVTANKIKFIHLLNKFNNLIFIELQMLIYILIGFSLSDIFKSCRLSKCEKCYLFSPGVSLHREVIVSQFVIVTPGT